jgi:gamma-glutamyltranspeptidase/glutathione hydrolase
MNLSLDTARDVLKIPIGETGSIPLNSVLAVTTPGAAAGWIDTVERFGSGKLTMKQILEPAIRLCEEGFPVGEVSARLVCTTHTHTERV